MKLSSAILALAACAGESSAFQAPALAAGRTALINNRVVGGALMAATMDGTAMSEQVANGAKRKKTKQVGSMRRY